MFAQLLVFQIALPAPSTAAGPAAGIATGPASGRAALPSQCADGQDSHLTYTSSGCDPLHWQVELGETGIL